jgi:long-subunit fatty acid transport protein
MIYKMSSSLRVAISLQTPTYFDQMNERMDGVLTPRVFGIPSFNAQGAPIIITKVGPVKLTPNEFSYQLSTPLRLSGGAAYLLGKKALISLDMEYVNYPGMKLASAELSATDDLNFQNKYNSQTQKNFQAGINIKAGTEIRLTPSFSLRGGVASFGNSYSATFDSIDRTMLQFSGGIGYRSNQFYVDLTGYQRTGKDAFTPYTLKNTADYSSATLTLTQSQFLVSAGVYF